MPTAPPPNVVTASRQTHSPSGGRSTCTVSSVLRKPHSRTSSAALAAGRRVDAGQQPLHRRERLSFDQAGWPHPHHARPRLVDAALDPTPLDRVEVAAVPMRRARADGLPSAGVCPSGAFLPGSARRWPRGNSQARPIAATRSRSTWYRSDSAERDRAAGAEHPGPGPRPGRPGPGPRSPIVNRPITRSAASSRPVDRHGPTGRRRPPVLRVRAPWPGGRRGATRSARNRLVGDACGTVEEGVARPISRTPVPLCIVLRRCPLAQSAERLHGKEKVYGSIP